MTIEALSQWRSKNKKKIKRKIQIKPRFQKGDKNKKVFKKPKKQLNNILLNVNREMMRFTVLHAKKS